MKGIKEYLTEESLGTLLYQLFPNEEFIHDKIVPNSECRTRPDYRCDNLMLIVEFDGDQHYKSVKKIKNEEFKNTTYKAMGYSVIRIPYFVQASSLTIKLLFGMDFTYEQIYKHGFVDDKVVLPCDFCEMGITKFKEDLRRFNIISTEIITSLRDKIHIHNDIELVLPSSLFYLID